MVPTSEPATAMLAATKKGPTFTGLQSAKPSSKPSNATDLKAKNLADKKLQLRHKPGLAL
jgi:hypothetical protein